jgi:hypothetical protein
MKYQILLSDEEMHLTRFAVTGIAVMGENPE